MSEETNGKIKLSTGSPTWSHTSSIDAKALKIMHNEKSISYEERVLNIYYEIARRTNNIPSINELSFRVFKNYYDPFINEIEQMIENRDGKETGKIQYDLLPGKTQTNMFEPENPDFVRIEMRSTITEHIYQVYILQEEKHITKIADAIKQKRLSISYNDGVNFHNIPNVGVW